MPIPRLINEQGEEVTPAPVRTPEERRKRKLIKLAKLIADPAAYDWDQIAEKLHVSKRTLATLIKDPQFPALFGANMVEMGVSYRVDVAQQEMQRLTYIALKTLKDVMESPRAAATARVAAANSILAMSKVNQPTEHGDRDDNLRKFLEGLFQGQTVQFNQVNIGQIIAASTPDDYLTALEAEQPALPAHVVSQTSQEEGSITIDVEPEE